MVYQNKFIQKTSGAFRERKNDDKDNKSAHYDNGNRNHGNQLFMYEECASWKSLYCNRVDVSSFLFHFPSEDIKNRKIAFGT